MFEVHYNDEMEAEVQRLEAKIRAIAAGHPAPPPPQREAAVISLSELIIGELAAYIAEHLRSKGIETVLVGGACRSIYSANTIVEPYPST